MVNPEQFAVVLNPSNEASIRNAGSREKALAFLEEMYSYAAPKVVDAVRNRTELKGAERDVSYARYLGALRDLVDTTYPSS